MSKKYLGFQPHFNNGEGLRGRLKAFGIPQSEVDFRASEAISLHIGPSIVSACLCDLYVYEVRKAAQDLINEKIWDSAEHFAVIDLKRQRVLSIGRNPKEAIWELEDLYESEIPDDLEFDQIDRYDEDIEQHYVLMVINAQLFEYFDYAAPEECKFEIVNSIAIHIQE